MCVSVCVCVCAYINFRPFWPVLYMSCTGSVGIDKGSKADIPLYSGRRSLCNQDGYPFVIRADIPLYSGRISLCIQSAGYGKEYEEQAACQ